MSTTQHSKNARSVELRDESFDLDTALPFAQECLARGFRYPPRISGSRSGGQRKVLMLLG
jgi:hypothetical protein